MVTAISTSHLCGHGNHLLIDSFVVRSLLVPALVALLGRTHVETGQAQAGLQAEAVPGDPIGTLRKDASSTPERPGVPVPHLASPYVG